MAKLALIHNATSPPLVPPLLAIFPPHIPINMSSESSTSPPSQHEFQQPKRKAAQAGLDGHTAARSVKRRASKACQCCRARKVRCNVTEHGAPCTNCRLDEVECIVSESRRKKSVALIVHHPFLLLSVHMSSCPPRHAHRTCSAIRHLFTQSTIPPSIRSIIASSMALSPRSNSIADETVGSGTKKTTILPRLHMPLQPRLAANSLRATPWTASRI